MLGSAVIEQALVALVVAANTVADDRMRPLELLREPPMPAITYQRISTPRPLAHNGDQGYAMFRVQINCWAERTVTGSGYAQVKQLAEEVRLALNGFSGTVAGVVVGLIQIDGERDETDPERNFERVLLEASGNYREAKP